MSDEDQEGEARDCLPLTWDEMKKLFGDDGTATRIANAMFRNNVRTLREFRELSMHEFTGMRHIGPKALARIRQVREQLGACTVIERPVPERSAVKALMSKREVCEYLGVSVKWFNRFAKSNATFPHPVSPFRTTWKWRRTDIEEYARRHKRAFPRAGTANNSEGEGTT